MNNKEIYLQRKYSKTLLDQRVGQNSMKNVVRFGLNESLQHALKKTEICYKLKELKKEFYTEAVLKGGGEADIFVLDNAVAIEILNSEKQDSIDDKKKRYPCRIVQIGIEEEWKEELIN